MSARHCGRTVHRTSMTRGSHAVTPVVDWSLGEVSERVRAGLPLPTDTMTTGLLR
jgi:hypothetical protein